MKCSRINVLWNVSDKDILTGELLSVGTEQLSIELKTSALLAVNLKVLHFIAGILEF